MKTVMLFYFGGFVAFCLNIAFITPLLMMFNFNLSLSILLLGLMRLSFVSRYLTGCIIRVQELLRAVLLGWLTLLNLVFVFPISMWIIYVLPTKVPSTPQAIDVALRLAVGYWKRAKRHIFFLMGARPFCEYSIFPRLQSECVSLFWPLVNSSITDSVATFAFHLASQINRTLRWFQGGFIVFIWTPLCYLGNASLAFFLFSQYLYMIAPLVRLFFAPVFAYNTAMEPDDETEQAVQPSNSRIYEALPVLVKENPDSQRHATLIRLLAISPDLHNRPISCKLQIANLSGPEKPSYEALSYVWGPPDMSQTIEINQTPFQVSRSLLRALIYLRHETETRTLWIDALCINQNDLGERSAQVLLMRQIYSQAAKVVVWLGENAPWAFDKMIESTRQYVLGAVSPADAIHYGTVRIVSNLLHRTWWTRVWIVQELVLARDVYIQCGKDIISWNHFCHLVEGSTRQPYFSKNSVYFEEFLALRANRDDRMTQERGMTSNSDTITCDNHEILVQIGHRSTDTLSLIYDFRARKATEPRDKVFAFQSLAETSDTHPLLVQPDYNRKIPFLSIDFARSHIHHSRTLSIMALAECASQRLNSTPDKPDNTNDNREQYIPSWCPAFMNNEAVQAGLHWRPFWTGLPGSDNETRFSAADNLPLIIPEIFASPSSAGLADGNAPYTGYHHKLEIQVIPERYSSIAEVGPVADASGQGLYDATRDVLDRQSPTIAPAFQRHLAWESVLTTWRKMIEKKEETHQQRHGSSQKINRGQKEDDTVYRPSLEEAFHLTLTAGKFFAYPSSDTAAACSKHPNTFNGQSSEPTPRPPLGMS